MFIKIEKQTARVVCCLLQSVDKAAETALINRKCNKK